MAIEVVKQRARGFISVNAHPDGCLRNVERQVQAITQSITGQKTGPVNGPRKVLVLGGSTGYGLASRIATAWGFGAATLGVFFERPPEGGKTATAGYYNTVALEQQARKDGLYVASLNGDAFSDEIKRQAVSLIRKNMGPVDLIVYSLASPRRTHPRTGQVHNAALKPIGNSFTGRTIELNSEKVIEITIPPAEEQEIADTVAVMGGDDWRMWMTLLLEEGLLAAGARTVAYSYIGPEITWPIYRDGTIGRAKKDLEKAAADMNTLLKNRFGGGAWISVNKAVVTQASAAIPVVPLYLSLLPGVMKAKGLEENTIQQMRRLFFDHLAPGKNPALDEQGRIRIDDREMRPDVQAEVAALWPEINSENLSTRTNFPAFKREFRGLFGFDVEGVDYDQPTEIDRRLDGGNGGS